MSDEPATTFRATLMDALRALVESREFSPTELDALREYITRGNQR